MSLIVDSWMNVQSAAAARARSGSPVLREVTANYFRESTAFRPRTFDDVLDDLDAAQVDLAVVSASAGLGSNETSVNYSIEEALQSCVAHPDRLRAALFLDDVASIARTCRRIEQVAPDPLLCLVQVVPLTLGEAIDSPRLYPVYERCEALGVPVSINVGLPGPRVRAKLQDPLLLDEILLDFPGLTILAAHMGHPWESLLIGLMRKYENLYLTNSAYLATYMTPEIVAFMNSSAGAGRVIFGSDAPLIPLQRAITAARALPLTPEASRGFLGGNAERVLGLSGADEANG